jgi:alkylhydroperoxidase family enzyme
VDGALADVGSARLDPRLQLTLAFLAKVTSDRAAVTAADIRTLLDAGVTRAQIEDALAVAFEFNVLTRLADTFRFDIPSAASFDAGARALLSRGYRL